MLTWPCASPRAPEVTGELDFFAPDERAPAWGSSAAALRVALRTACTSPCKVGVAGLAEDLRAAGLRLAGAAAELAARLAAVFLVLGLAACGDSSPKNEGVVETPKAENKAWSPPSCGAGDPVSCVKRDYEDAEKLLERELALAMDRLRACSPANSTKCDNLDRQVELVTKEQNAWQSWRDAHCDVLAFGVEQTSAEEQVRSDCRTKITHERIENLREIGRP